MNNSPLVKFLSIVGMVLGLLGIYFGGLLPLLKAQAFIDAQRNVQSVRTVEDFEADFNTMFGVYSPVGTEEVTKFLAGNVLDIISSGQSQQIADDLVSWIAPHLDQNDVLHLILGGQLYQTLWEEYHQESDYQTAVTYYITANAYGPNLPPPLYSLLGLYKDHGDVANTERIAKIILSKWPNDTATQQLLQQVEKQGLPQLTATPSAAASQ